MDELICSYKGAQMKRIDIVYNKLKEISKGKKGLDARELAAALNLSRANVSSDLNKLWKMGKVEKYNGRPVLYLPLERDENSLDGLGKISRALITSVEQAKAAILYPQKKMHTLILGETGVGKTMFAELMYKYAVDVDKVRKDAPFIIFNCADYVNNPQLLISQLFGVKKGAYTGADCDKEGLIEKADGGILFLDEVHRLPPEGQEMFFTFMDRGTFRRLGETNQEKTAEVLIISATTENLNSSLLKTFTRRIPMIIKIPNLEERGSDERFHLIKSFLKEESFRLGKEVKVSTNSMKCFLSYHCPNNVGQLKTDIQLSCAKAYADYLTGKKYSISIDSSDLAPHVREGILKSGNNRNIWDEFIGISGNYFIFNPNQGEFSSESSENDKNIYEIIDSRVNELKNMKVSNNELERIMEEDIRNYFTRYLDGVDHKISKSNVMNIIDPSIINLIDEIVEISQKKLQKDLGQRVYLAMALHIQALLDRIGRGKAIINPDLNRIRSKYKKEFNIALQCVELIEKRFKIHIPIDEAGFLTMFFVFDSKINVEKKKVGILVIAHGNSVASSIVEAANYLLGTQGPVAIDLPFDVKPEIILDKVRKCINEARSKKEYLFLVDMGSLLNFGNILEEELGIPIKTIHFVSTPHVIEATRKAMMGYNLDDIYRDLMALNQGDGLENSEAKQIEKPPKQVIVTVCLTGEGSALAIKNFLENHLQFDSKVLDVVSLSLTDRDGIIDKLEKIQKDREVICIVSPYSIRADAPVFHIEDVLMKEAVKEIQDIIDTEEIYRKMGETLSYHLKKVDGREVLKHVRRAIVRIQNKLDFNLDSGDLVGIVLHISCMIDRLKAMEPVVEYPNKEKRKLEDFERYMTIRESLKALEDKFRIDIVDDEVCYILDFFSIDTENKTI